MVCVSDAGFGGRGECQMRAGHKCTIVDLSKRADLNGSKCRLLKFHTDTSRWAVEVVNGDKKISIREANLRLWFELAALVKPNEAKLFQELAHLLSAGALTNLNDRIHKQNGVLDVVRATLIEVLKTETVELDVRGSIQKGTHTLGSDVDIVIRTPDRRVSHLDKEAVAAALRERPPFHRRHVHVGRLTIACVASCHEIDLVFANTEEFAPLARSHDRFEHNTSAQNAARMLKVSVRDTLSPAGRMEKVHSFLLELLVLEVQHAHPALAQTPAEVDDTLQVQQPCAAADSSLHVDGDGDGDGDDDDDDGSLSRHADGSMQLFVAALQVLLDAPEVLGDEQLSSPAAMSLMLANYEPGDYVYPALKGESERSAPGRAGPVGFHARRQLQRHAESVLALFTASRVYSGDKERPGRFVRTHMVELWARNLSTCNFMLDTPLGPVPGWLVGCDGYLLPRDQIFGWLHLGGGHNEEVFTHDASATIALAVHLRPMAEMLRSSPYGVYAMAAVLDRRERAQYAEQQQQQQQQPQKQGAGTSSPMPPCDPTSLSCWEHVLFRNCVRIVDPSGSGTDTDLCAAVRAALAKSCTDHGTSIIVLAGTHQVEPICVDAPSNGAMHLQIVGEGEEVFLVGSKRYIESKRYSASTLITALGANTRLTLMRMQLRMRNDLDDEATHCAGVWDGATLRLEHCSAVSSAAALFANGEGASLHLHDCTVPHGADAGCLVCNHAHLIVQDSTFSQLKHIAIEVREEATCELQRCTFTGCKSQAILQHRGGRQCSLDACTISASGSHSRTGALFITRGLALLSKCRIEENHGDGVVIEASEGTPRPRLEMRSCVVRSNAQNGVVIYGGSALVEDSRLQENAMTGLSALSHNGNYNGNYVSIGAVELRRNTLIGNGGTDMMLPSAWLDFEKVILDSNHSRPAWWIDLNDAQLRELDHNIMALGPEAMASSLGPKLFMRDAFTGLEMRFGESASASQCVADSGGEQAGRQLGKKASKKEAKAAREAAAAAQVAEMAREAATAEAQRRTMQLPASEGMQFAYFDKQTLMEEQQRAIDQHAAMPEVPRMADITKGVGCPETPSRVATPELRPCTIADLADSLGRRASGRILWCELCTGPIRQKSLMTVITDLDGGLGGATHIPGGRSALACKLALYHLPCIETDGWRRCFPLGMRIGIKEPFVKRYAHGGCGIRVDFASDLVYLTRVCSWFGCGAAETTRGEFYGCARCNTTCYCSRSCQVADWKFGGHNKLCVAVVHAD